METFTPPALKPVLVTKASDDIRAIRGTDASAQQAVPTFRALKDLLSGDVISLTSPTTFDRKYIRNTAGDGEDPIYRVDLNYVTDASVRYIEEDSYVNGPAYAYYLDSESIKHVQEGILHTYAQMPNEELTWDTAYWMSPNCIENPDTAKPGSTAMRGDTILRHPAPGATIRQLFYPKNASVQDSNGYTRIGTYEGYDEENGVEVYTWGDWGWISGKKMYIIVTEATADEVTTPIVNAVYSVHTSISEFVLPDARSLAEGSSITLIQYPDPNSDDPGAWASLVTYTDPDDPTNVMRTLATAAPIRNTTKNREGYLEGLAPTEYEFVVVPVIEEEGETKRQTGRTWELQVDADETDFTAGISDMLSSHTDPGVNDIIDYAARKYKEEDVTASQSNTDILAITRAMMTSGYVYGTVRKEADGLSNVWSLSVQKLTVTGADNPNFVEATESHPDATTLYFVRRTDVEGDTEEVTYQLALDPDYPDLDPGYLNPTRPSGDAAFPKVDDAQFYKLTDDAKLVREDILNTSGEALTTGKEIQFRSYFNRHDLIYVAITPSGTQNHSEARKFVNVKLGIIPDPHQGVYICNDTLNPSAYTHAKVVQAKKSGTIVMRDSDTYANMPISTAAVMAAYDDITTRAQKRGLLTGIINAGEITLTQLNEIKQTGLYYVTPSDVTAVSLTPGSYPIGITTDPAHLIVIGGETAAADMRNEEDQYFETEDDVFDPDKTYYYWSIKKDAYVKNEAASFDDELKPYYEKREVGYEKNGSDVIQMLIQFGTTKNFWFRKFEQASGAWTIWTGMSKDPYVLRVPMGPGILTTLESSAVLNALKQGKPYITLELTKDASADVMLPSHYPAGSMTLPVGADLMFRITGSGSISVTFHYTDLYGIARTYTVTGIPTGSDAVVLQLINSGSHWMFGRTDISFGTATV